MATGMMHRGMALTRQGQSAEGIEQMQQGLAAWQETGAGRWANWLAYLAEAYRHAGRTQDGIRLLAEAVAVGDATGEHNRDAEIYRLQGESLLVMAGIRHTRHGTGRQVKAEGCFRQALDLARRQQAKVWELRAAVQLTRLWQHQGKRTEAYQLLAPIYGWFTEGRDTADLQEAKMLLEQLEP
jgi:tetratricopeptide (TPR) repeat protein